MTTITATLKHVREAGVCMRGARAWAMRQGFDWTDFRAHGIDVAALEATGDAFALRVATAARAEAKRNG